MLISASPLGQDGAEVVLSGAGLGERGLEGFDRFGERWDVLADGREHVARDIQRPAFLLDLVERDDPGPVFDVLEVAVPRDDLVGVLGIEEVLGAALLNRLDASMMSTFFLRAAGFLRRRTTTQPAS